MKRCNLAIRRTWQTVLMVSLLALVGVPAWAQQGGGEGGGSDVSVTTSETTTMDSSWTSDWRIWALVGVLVLVVLVIALTRGRGGSSTTVVK
jgi:ABC-type transporter Mla subunit MlaD